MTGNGATQIVLRSYEHISTCARPHDKYLVAAASRGCDEGITLISILERVGIPERSADCKPIYDAFIANELQDPKTCQQVMETYNCWKIEIIGLFCFDTVVARGLPRTGVLRWVPHRHAPVDYTNILAPIGNFPKVNVASSGEIRAPYYGTLLHDAADTVELDSTEPNKAPINVFFAGTHSDMMKGPVSLFPVIYVLSHLDALGIVQDRTVLDTILAEHSSGPIEEAFTSCLTADGIQSYKDIYRLVGTKERRLDQMAHPGYTANIQVHPSVHARGFGLTRRDKAVLGHHHDVLSDGRGVWVADTASISDAELVEQGQSQLVMLETEWTDFEKIFWRLLP